MAVESLIAVAFAAAIGAIMLTSEPVQPSSGESVAGWMAPASGAPLAHAAVIETLANRGVVLLGESHTDAGHHLWQLDTIAAIHGRTGAITLGFEAFPRQAQPILDAWVAGKLTEDEFLEKTRWRDVWGYDAALYLPLFRFARMHRIPMAALNVDHALPRRVAREGWQAVPPESREGVGQPAPPAPEYRNSLFESFSAHRHAGADPDADSPAFQRFVEAQLVWDRAMAEAIARAAEQGRAIIAIIGTGHVEYRYGVPRQLKDLGVGDVAVALPWPAETPCPPPDAAATPIADFLFRIPSAPDEAASR